MRGVRCICPNDIRDDLHWSFDKIFPKTLITCKTINKAHSLFQFCSSFHNRGLCLTSVCTSTASWWFPKTPAVVKHSNIVLLNVNLLYSSYYNIIWYFSKVNL